MHDTVICAAMSETSSPSTASEAPWTANDATFAARLVLIRQRMGWNAKEAALACGIPQQSWRTWETGVMPHGGRYFGICAQIAAVTHCDYGWLVDRRPSESYVPSRPKIVGKLRMIRGGGHTTPPRTPLVTPV